MIKGLITGYNKIICVLSVVVMIFTMVGCGKKQEAVLVDVTKSSTTEVRSNEPRCLTPVGGGEVVTGADDILIDSTNASEGYLYVTYTGDNSDVKMQIHCMDEITYTYKIGQEVTVVPLTEGSGDYHIDVYAGMGNGQYSSLYSGDIPINITNEFGPYIYPNYYVEYDADSKAVAKGKELATTCTCDLEVIAAVYDYVIANISYDHDEALNVASNYVPDVDEVLASKKGICFDYASLMTAMLRSQRIPTRLEVGYAGDAYHAWITTYVEDIGWINGMIQFDGADWTLMDPTFAANADTKTLEEFVGDGNNYATKYVY